MLFPRACGIVHDGHVASNLEYTVRPLRRLPTEPAPRALALVERSRPNPERPRLADPELEAKMTAMEQARAIEYAAQEDALDRLERAVEEIEDSQDGTVLVELADDDSIVHHAANLLR